MLKSEDFKAKQNIVRLIVSCHNETPDLKGGRSAVINYPVTKMGIKFVEHDMHEESKKGQNVYSNLYSQAVTHPSTNRSQPCLTSVIGRELVYSR